MLPRRNKEYLEADCALNILNYFTQMRHVEIFEKFCRSILPGDVLLPFLSVTAELVRVTFVYNFIIT